MSGIWVDTDFGFDDLWALLLLRHLGCRVAGVSLVAGNAPLPQILANACGARAAYGFDWPIWQGAAGPLQRQRETATRILGPTGMRSRGARLPSADTREIPKGAIGAISDWLHSATGSPRTILALGPLTNIARLLQQDPQAQSRITRLVWMGGSAGRGNHTPKAEFNAVADAEALAEVIASDFPIDIVELEFCRSITFCNNDLPETDPLTRDLLGGYLDIALGRGRPSMAIYDPLAALAVAEPKAMTFTPCDVHVSTASDETYGATRIAATPTGSTRIATGTTANLAQICLDALTQEALDGARV